MKLPKYPLKQHIPTECSRGDAYLPSSGQLFVRPVMSYLYLPLQLSLFHVSVKIILVEKSENHIMLNKSDAKPIVGSLMVGSIPVD